MQSESVPRDVLYHGIIPYLGPRLYFMMQHICKNFPILLKSKGSVFTVQNEGFSIKDRHVVSSRAIGQPSGSDAESVAQVFYWFSPLQIKLISVLASCGFCVWVYTEHSREQVWNRATKRLEIHVDPSHVGMEIDYRAKQSWIKYTSTNTTSTFAPWCQLGRNPHLAFSLVADFTDGPSTIDGQGFDCDSRRAFSTQQANLLHYVLAYKQDEEETAKRCKHPVTVPSTNKSWMGPVDRFQNIYAAAC